MITGRLAMFVVTAFHFSMLYIGWRIARWTFYRVMVALAEVKFGRTKAPYG